MELFGLGKKVGMNRAREMIVNHARPALIAAFCTLYAQVADVEYNMFRNEHTMYISIARNQYDRT